MRHLSVRVCNQNIAWQHCEKYGHVFMTSQKLRKVAASRMGVKTATMPPSVLHLLCLSVLFFCTAQFLIVWYNVPRLCCFVAQCLYVFYLVIFA